MIYLLLGLSLGVSAGVTPGPLNALVVSTTIQYGWLSGLRVTIAPLITDLPIILLSVFFVNNVPDNFAMILQIFGGGYLIFLSWKTFNQAKSSTALEINHQKTNAGTDLLQGALANLTNPSPYIFWTSVGAPIIIGAFQISLLVAFGFLLAFYSVFVLLLIGQVFVIAFLLSRKRTIQSILAGKKLAPALLFVVGVILIARSVVNLT